MLCLCHLIPALLVLGLVLSLESGNSIEDVGAAPRIVEGSKAESLSVAPFQVSLRHKNQHFCGGSIIDDYWIVSAAHCIVNTKLNAADIEAVVGTLTLDEGGDHYEIEKAITHPQYIQFPVLNDISLLKVKQPFQKDRGYGPIALSNKWTAQDVDLVLTGWGLTQVTHKWNSREGLV